jgi:4-amino-4-deoxy-L-arabinose transferase-like glycosyltransferase
MALIPRFRTTDLLLLLLTVAVAAGVRAAYLNSCADGGAKEGPLRVQDERPALSKDRIPPEMRDRPHVTELDVLVQNVREHDNFASHAPFATDEEPTAHASPGYPYCLAMLGRKVAAEQVDRTVRWIQCALGALTAGLYFLFARRAFRSLFVGAFAGLLAAVYPFWVVNTAAIDDGVLATFLLALVLFLGARACQTAAPLASLFFGLALAGLALVRAALLPFAFAAVVWFLLRTRTLRRGWLPAVLAFFAFVLGLTPWTVRNYELFHEPLPIVDSAYYHLWIGNNPDATGGPAVSRKETDSAEEKLKQIERQPQRYARLSDTVREQWRDHPVESLRRRGRAFLGFFLGDRWLKDGEVVEVTTEGQPPMPDWLASSYKLAFQATLLGMLALALLGWRWSYGWRWESMPGVLAALWIPLVYILGHAESLSGPRLPLDGLLLCYAAFAVCCCLPTVGGSLREGGGTQEVP